MKDADQLRGKFAANQCLCVCCIINSAITLILNNFQASKHLLSVKAVQPGLYRTWSETSNTGVLAVQLVPESHDKPSQMNCAMRKHDFYMYDTKAADQLRCNFAAGQRLDSLYKLYTQRPKLSTT